MSSVYWTFTTNLIAGEVAKAEKVNLKFSEIDAAFEAVQGDVWKGIRIDDGTTPNSSTFKLTQAAGARANRLLGFDSAGALSLLAAGFVWRGDWATATNYAVNDLVRGPVEAAYSLYIVRATHTSSVFATDVGANRLAVAVDLTEARRSLILHELIVGPNTVQLVAGQDVMVDVTAGPVTLTLPLNATISDQPINVMHVGGSVGNNPITIARNGHRIMGALEDMIVDTPNASFGLAYCDATRGWRVRGV